MEQATTSAGNGTEMPQSGSVEPLNASWIAGQPADTTSVTAGPEAGMTVRSLKGEILKTKGSQTARSVSWVRGKDAQADYYYDDYDYYGSGLPGDTITIHIPKGWFPVPKSLGAEEDAPSSIRDAQICTSTHLAVDDGLEAVMTKQNDMPNSVLVGCILAFLIFIALNIGEVRRLFRNFGQDVWSVRNRSNSFDDRTTNENRTLGVMMLMASAGEGIFMASGTGMETGNLTGVALMAGIAVCYNVFQLLCYMLVGWVFADATGRQQWLRGYVSSQSMLGLLILPAGLAALLHPGSAEELMWVAIGLFLTARLVFIAKGVKIFYHKLPSILYFILYLCALEIIPLLIAVSAAQWVATKY